MNFFLILPLVIVALILLWFGYTLFFRVSRRGEEQGGRREGRSRPDRRSRRGVPGTGIDGGRPGDPQTCPVCTARLPPGRLVRSAVYPSQNGKDRLMHIMGCPYCLEGEPAKRRRRVCPVCHKPIADTEYLFARIFERPGKSHIHVLGCINCRGPRAMR